MDYGHPIEFGFFLVPDASDPAGALETARLLDRTGYDLIGVQDHPYQRRHLDTLALMGVILAQTKSVRVFSAVHELPLRPAPMLAKAAATLDRLSGGRFELGLGAGGFLEPAHKMGAPALTPGASLEALEEAVAIARAMWSTSSGGIRFSGRHYQLDGIFPGPAPAHPIQIWIGANKPRALRLTGRVADGWVPPLMNWKPPALVAQDSIIVDQAAEQAGRDPREIRRIYLVTGALTQGSHGTYSDTDTAVVGPPERWVEVLTHLALDIGIGSFVLATDPEPRALTTFIEEIAPKVRERVAERRGAPVAR